MLSSSSAYHLTQLTPLWTAISVFLVDVVGLHEQERRRKPGSARMGAGSAAYPSLPRGQ